MLHTGILLIRHNNCLGHYLPQTASDPRLGAASA